MLHNKNLDTNRKNTHAEVGREREAVQNKSEKHFVYLQLLCLRDEKSESERKRSRGGGLMREISRNIFFPTKISYFVRMLST